MYYAGRQLGAAESCVNYLYGRVCLYLITNESYYSDVCMRRNDDRQYNKLRVHGNMAELSLVKIYDIDIGSNPNNTVARPQIMHLYPVKLIMSNNWRLLSERMAV